MEGSRLWLETPAPGGPSYEEAGNGYLLLTSARAPIESNSIDPAPFVRSPAVLTALRNRIGSDTVSWRGRWRVATYPVLSAGRVAAVVLVARRLGEVQQVMERLLLVLVALLPVALVGAGLGGLVLAGRVLRPVDEITRAAEEISEKDLSRRLVIGTRDELGRLAATFNRLIERLEGAFERQRRFTADASHELRTPLAVIRAITSQKLMQARTIEEYRAALQQIDDASAYMARLVRDLLLLARADSGQLALSLDRLDLSELLRHTAAQVSEVSGRPIPVSTPGPVEIDGDAVRLTGLFLNLLENAVRHTPPDGKVQLSLSRTDHRVEVEVSDNGEGIPPEHLPHIFERFYRVDKARAREEGGTGLGLAIGRWVVEAHGGTISARSQPGSGATIIVTLPSDRGAAP